MKTSRVLCLVCLYCLAGGQVWAAAIGMPARDDRFGIGLGYARLTVDDPQGATAEEWVARPLNLIYTAPARDAWRYWAEAFYQDAVLPASTTEIGQRVSQLGIRASLQRQLGTHTLGSSFLGLGLQLARERFENRHRVDSAGFLGQTFPDRAESNAALILNYTLEREMQGWDVAGKLEQSLPVGEGAQEFSLAIIVLFGF